MTAQVLLSVVFFSASAAFGYLNYKTYFVKKETVSQEKTTLEIEKRKKEVLQRKIIEIIEPEKETIVRIKQISKTESIPSPIPIMIRRENILEEKPSPIPVWVITMKQQNPAELYFIGTRTKATDLKTALTDAKKLGFEEIYKYIGVKMDYEMRLETVSSEDVNEIQEKRFQDIQLQVLGNIPDREKIIQEKGNYYRKIKETDGNFYEAHVIVACNIESLKKAIGESIDKVLNDLSLKSQESDEEKKKKAVLLNLIKSKRGQLLQMSAKEQEAYEMKRKQYEIIEREKNMSDLSFNLFLGEKSLFFGKKEESRQHLQKAYNELVLKTKDLSEIIETEESMNDSLETKIIKRLKKSELYFKKANCIDGYQYTILALEALLFDYEQMKNRGLLNNYLVQIDKKLFENIGKIPEKTYTHYDLVEGKVVLKGEGRGNIFAYFNKAGQLLCSFIKEDEGNVYSFYSGDKIIYKMVKMNNRDAVRNFGLYDQQNKFIKEIK